MTKSGLRREIARGRLECERTAGKQYVTLAAIERMRAMCRENPKVPASTCAKRRGREAVYAILDGKNEVGTGCGRNDRPGAEKALADYLGRKRKPDWLSGHPAEVAVADVLAFYGAEKAPTLIHPELVGYHLTPLLKHFGNSTCWQVDGDSCEASNSR